MAEQIVPLVVDVDEVWSDVFGSGWEESPWWVRIHYGDGDWDKPSTSVVMKHWGKEDDNVLETTTLTIDQVIAAYAKLLAQRWTHCNGCSVSDADACTSDAVLQYAIYGEFIYG